MKVFRLEAVRTGFKSAYDRQDYKTIVEVAAKLPESVLQEDEKLLMYYDVATMHWAMRTRTSCSSEAEGQRTCTKKKRPGTMS